MASKRIGALIVIGRQSQLGMYADRGEIINAKISAELLETIFFKNTPLHDGAVLIEEPADTGSALPPSRNGSICIIITLRHETQSCYRNIRAD